MYEVIEILGLACLGLLSIVAEPAILIKRYLGFREEQYDTYSNLKRFVYRLINCALCFTFWFSLIISFSLYKAAIASVIAELIYKKLKSL